MLKDEAQTWLDSQPNGFSITKYRDQMYRVTVETAGGKYISGFDAIFADAVLQVKEKVEALGSQH